MRVSHRMRHILSIPFNNNNNNNNNKRLNRADPTTTTDWKEKDTAAAAVTVDINANDNEVGDLTDSKSSSTSESDNDSSAPSASDSEDNTTTTTTAATRTRTNSNSNSNNGKRRQVRIITWHLDDTAIPPGYCRWSLEQERELQIAEQELARCQKAWSSEQEVWLAYIKTLNDEKEAHLDFLHLRAKQQEDERVHFRKVWSRRRSSEQDREGSGLEAEASDDAAGNAYGLWRTQSRLRRLRRFS